LSDNSKNITIFIFSTVSFALMLLILLEVFLIHFNKGSQISDGDYGWSTWNPRMEFYPKYLDYKKTTPARSKMKNHVDEVNQFGFRGIQMGKSTKNIILLGDSQVETSHLLELMPERFLAEAVKKSIGIKPNVISMGSWGWGTDQQYLALEKYIDKINPSIVLLWFTANDFRDNTYPIGNSGRKPTFWLTTEGLQGPNHGFLEKFNPEKSRITRLLKRREVFGINTDQDKGFFKTYVEPNLKDEPVKILCQDEVDFDLSKNIYDFNPYDVSLLSLANVRYAQPRPSWLEYQKSLTNRILNKINDLVESRDSRFIVFYVDTPKDTTLFPKEAICSSKYGEVTYSIKNFDVLLEDTFDGVLNYKIDLPMDNFKDSFDGHLNDLANEHVMKEVSNLIFNAEL
jgi:hypothetical protein